MLKSKQTLKDKRKVAAVSWPLLETMMDDYVTIVGFLCHDDITIDLEFSDGTHQLVDIGAFIRRHPHPQYDKYLKPSNFRKCRLEYGNVCWDNDLEFHIEDLYRNVISA